MTSDARHDHLTPGEAARILGVSPKTVSRWADRGWLSHIVTVGGHRRFRRAEIEALEQRLTRAGPSTSGTAAP